MVVRPTGRLADTDGTYSPGLEGRIVMRNDDDRYRNGIGSGRGESRSADTGGGVSVAWVAYGGVSADARVNVTQG